MKPQRIQLSRKKGFRLPPNTVSVARPSVWGNPFRVSEERTQKCAVEEFDQLLETGGLGLLNEDNIVRCLKGKNLACWCELGTPCHADTLLKIANR